jgi:hypothetical protein
MISSKKQNNPERLLHVALQQAQFGFHRRSQLQVSSEKWVGSSVKRRRTPDYALYALPQKQAFSLVFGMSQKRSQKGETSPKRSWREIRGVLGRRLESPALSPQLRAFPPERSTKWH